MSTGVLDAPAGPKSYGCDFSVPFWLSMTEPSLPCVRNEPPLPPGVAVWQMTPE